MAQKTPAPLDPQVSQFHANGDPKSPEFRGIEKTRNNTTAKANRWADALDQEGLSADQVRQVQLGRVGDEQIEAGAEPRWDNIVDYLVGKGRLPAGETPPNSSMPELLDELRKREGARPATKTPEVSSQPAKSAKDMTRAELAKQAGLPEDATTEQIMRAMADALEEEKPKAAVAGKGKK